MNQTDKGPEGDEFVPHTCTANCQAERQRRQDLLPLSHLELSNSCVDGRVAVCLLAVDLLFSLNLRLRLY